MATKGKKKTPAQKLGLAKMKLSVRSCRLRTKELRAGVKDGKFKGETAKLARRWANWYAAKANLLERQKGEGK